MKEKIGVSKAARLLKVSRSELQALIKSGQLDTFEGKVDLDELKKMFPTINVELDSVHRDLEFIRRAAFSNRVQSRLMPSSGDVQSRLEKIRVQLLVEKQKSAVYSNIMEELLQHMINVRANASDEEKAIVDKLSQWLADKLETAK